MSLVDEPAARLRQDIADGREVIKRMEAALAVLEGRGPQTEPQPHSTRRTRRTTRRRGTRRTTTRSNGAGAMEDRERVLEAVISGAEKGEAIADSAKVGYRTALRHLNAMQTEGLVSRDGERQQTRWRPTDAAPDFLSRTREIAKASVK